MHSLVADHAFVDSNKRVGVASAELFLLVNGSKILATDDELEELAMQVARGELEVEGITIWIRQRVTDFEP